MKAGWIRLALGASVSGVMAASAGVEFGTLTAESLKGPDAALAKLGVEPGDVRVSNDFVQLVIRAGKGAGDAAGSALVIPPGDISMSPSTPFRPGPAVGWKNPKYRKDSLQGAVRFESAGQGWEARLEYELADKSPWVSVRTVIINADEQRSLHLPMVDGFAPFEDAKVDNLQGAAFVVGDDGKYPPVFALVPVSGAKTELERGSGGRWYLGFPGVKEKEEPNRKSRVPFFNRTPTGPNKPIPADRDQGRFRNEETWVRIAPGGRAEFERRLIASFGKAETRSIVELAKQDAATSAPEKELAEAEPAPRADRAEAPRTAEPELAATGAGDRRPRSPAAKVAPTLPRPQAAERTASAEPTAERKDSAESERDQDRNRKRKFPFNLFGRNRKEDEPRPRAKAAKPSDEGAGRSESVAAKPPAPRAAAPANPGNNAGAARSGVANAGANRVPPTRPAAPRGNQPDAAGGGRPNVPQVASRPDRGRLIQGNQRGPAGSPNGPAVGRIPPTRSPATERAAAPIGNPAADGLGSIGPGSAPRSLGRESAADMPPPPRPVAAEGTVPPIRSGVITGEPRRAPERPATVDSAPAKEAKAKPARSGGITAEDRANLESILKLPDPSP